VALTATGVFGGAFDPPHNGHVALLEGAERAFDLERLLVVVVAEPGHRTVYAPADARLAMARLAFPGREVELDEHARTIDMLRARRLEDPVLILGSDELADFPNWKESATVLELARLAVGARPGVDLDVSSTERVLSFEIDGVDVSSTEVRRRVAAGEPVEDLVPPLVAAEIERLGLYRPRQTDG
jgi:nicotinate-nucleotide adenylyltransferase